MTNIKLNTTSTMSYEAWVDITISSWYLETEEIYGSPWGDYYLSTSSSRALIRRIGLSSFSAASSSFACY